MTMAYTQSPRDEPASIGPLDGLIDLWFSTEHTLASEVNSDPIENGSPLTDHIVRRPNKLRLHGGVSDVEGSKPLDQRASMAWAKIEMMQRQRDVFSVTTHLGTYNNMVITRAQHTTSEATGLSLQVRLEVTEALFVPRQTPAAVLLNQDRRPLAAIEEDIDRARREGAAAAAIASFEAEAFVVTQFDQTNRGRRQSLVDEGFDAGRAIIGVGLARDSSVRMTPNEAHREALRAFGG